MKKETIQITMEGSGSSWKRELVYDPESDDFFVPAIIVGYQLIDFLKDARESLPAIFHRDRLFVSLAWALRVMENPKQELLWTNLRDRIKSGIEAGIFPIESPVA